MKLAYYLQDGERLWGAADPGAGTIRRIGGKFEEWAPEATVKGSKVIDLQGPAIRLSEVKLLPPVIPGAEIIGSGINYASWAIPPEGADTCFEFKSTTSIIGMEDVIRFPGIIDHQPRCEYRYEIELAAVFGLDIDEPTPDGIKSILGYTVFNDGCLRGQRTSAIGFDWTGSKCGFQSSSVGPWIATRDEFGDGQPDFRMIARTNGVVTTDGRSSGMNLKLNALIEQLTQRTAVSPGDIFFTGTPGYKNIPDGVVGPGDDMEFEIEGIGVLRNRIENRNRPFAGAEEAGDRELDIPASLEKLRAWDGQDVFDVKQVLDRLIMADPDDRQGWQKPAREILSHHNKDEWPEGARSANIDWWAIDRALRRLYQPDGQKVIATGYFPHRREGDGGTA